MPGLLTGGIEEAILLIDDDTVSREVLATVLTMRGYLVQSVASGQEAVAMLKSGTFTPQGILVDLRMSGLSGAELIAQLHAFTSATVIAISASDPAPDAIAGADGFLLKPFAPEELAPLLARHITAAQLETQAAEAHGPAALDGKILAQLRAAMPEESVRALYTVALADLHKRVGALEDAIERGDAAMVRLIGHTIKGGCGVVGAAEAAHLGALLEMESDKLDDSRAIVLRLHAAAEHLKYILDAEFKAAQDGSPA